MMTLDDRLSRAAVELLYRLALNAGEQAIPVYAPGVAELAKFYLDNFPADTAHQLEKVA